MGYHLKGFPYETWDIGIEINFILNYEIKANVLQKLNF